MEQRRVVVIAKPIMQKLYSAGGALCGLPGIGSEEDFSVKKIDHIILSILHFQFAFALGLDKYISK